MLLSVSRKLERISLRHFSRSDDGLASQQLRKNVINISSHGRRCHFCNLAFGDGQHFEIHNLDGDHTNLESQNVVPACELCHGVHHLDFVWRKWPGYSGKIIFLPEISQEQLNAMFWALVFAKKTKPESNEIANAIAKLESRQQVIPEYLDKLRDPFSLSVFLKKLNDQDYENRGVLLNGLRWLPPVEPLMGYVNDWGSSGAAFSQLHPDNWQQLLTVVGA